MTVKAQGISENDEAGHINQRLAEYLCSKMIGLTGACVDCRLEELKRDASYAEERASQVVGEVTSSQANVAKRQGALDSGAQQLALSRNAIDQLAQEYAAAVSDAEMCDALVQRELREAQVCIRPCRAHHDATPIPTPSSQSLTTSNLVANGQPLA